jgi:hypothetical protein
VSSPVYVWLLLKNSEMATTGLEKGNTPIKCGKNMAILAELFKSADIRSKVQT